jgi:hypothetical protein
MKTKNKEKTFDAVKMMRDARDKISNETQGMSFKELKQYMEERLKGEKIFSAK